MLRLLIPSSLPSDCASGEVVSKSGRDMRNGSFSAGAAALMTDADTNEEASVTAPVPTTPRSVVHVCNSTQPN